MRKCLLFLCLLLSLFLCSCDARQTILASSATDHVHSYAPMVIDASCTQAGCTVHVCACGDAYVTETELPTGHSFTPWKTVKEPTSDTEGLRQRHCAGCELTEEASIAILPEGHTHTYTATQTPPTCLEPGFTTHSCTCGDSYSDSETPALGHSFAEYKSNGDATCLQDGTMTAVCDRCKQTNTRTETGSATGHQYTETVVPPTCQQGGFTQYVCACGDSYQDNVTEITDHTWGDWVTTKEPTAEEDGIRQRKCQHCDAMEESSLQYAPETTEPPAVTTLCVISWSETVGRNETASVTIQGKPGVEYDIDVHYKSGVSTAKGLENQIADADGKVTWTWKIGNRTAAGTYEIIITGGGETVTIEFAVVVP